MGWGDTSCRHRAPGRGQGSASSSPCKLRPQQKAINKEGAGAEVGLKPWVEARRRLHHCPGSASPAISEPPQPRQLPAGASPWLPVTVLQLVLLSVPRQLRAIPVLPLRLHRARSAPDCATRSSTNATCCLFPRVINFICIEQMT